MAAIEPILGFGVTLKRAATTTVGDTNFTAIDGLLSFKPPGIRGEVKVTTQHVLGALKRHSKATGISDVTDAQAQIYFDPDLAQHAAMLADNESLVFRDYEIEFPDTTNKWRFRGQLHTFDVSNITTGEFIMADLAWSILTLDTTVP